LAGEVIFKALSANTNPLLTDDVVTSYSAHQFITYNFPQSQSQIFDPLMNLYANYYNGTYPHRDALDKLVLPIVRRILVRETGRGFVNWVEQYVAPNTIGANHATLLKYEGKYQFTDVPNDKVNVEFHGAQASINWQERAHFGTIKPFFNPLTTYVQGLFPSVINTTRYDRDLAESQTYGSNDPTTKDSYNWNTPIFWINNWAHLPNTWSQIARANLDPKLSNLETARMYAALGEGIFEACNANYGMKWGKLTNTSVLWRPITAIRSGDTFGHAAVPSWTPEIDTPMHPEYPSGHCAHTGAAMQVLRLVLGRDNVTVVVKTDYNTYTPNSTLLPNRKFTSLTDLLNDVGNSRILGGVHYRHSCEDGAIIGAAAANASYAFFYKKGTR